MKNYAEWKTFISAKKRKMNNKWIFCYYLNGFCCLTLTFLRFSRNILLQLFVFRKNSTSYEWVFHLLRVFPAFTNFFYFFSQSSLFVLGEKETKIVEGRLLLLDDSILSRLFMLKYSWCLLAVAVGLLFPPHEKSAACDVNFTRSTPGTLIIRQIEGSVSTFHVAFKGKAFNLIPGVKSASSQRKIN